MPKRVNPGEGERPKGNQRCPCGSRRFFKNCCSTKRFEWIADGNGGWDRSVPLDRQGRKVFAEMRKQFIDVFDREPGPDDHISLLTYVTDPQTMIDEWVKAGERVGTDPALLYATQKTGLIVVQGYTDRIPEQRLAEWYAAVEEYKTRRYKRPSKLDALGASLKKEYERLPYMLGALVRRSAAPSPVEASGTDEFQDGFLFFCIARTGKTVRSLRHLIDDNLGEDALNLVRSVYENYLYMMYSIVNPLGLKQLVDARLGIVTGTHAYSLTKSGRQNRREIIELRTGKRLRADISTSEIARMSPFPSDVDIHSFLYSFLSGYTHPHVMTLDGYIDAEEVRFSITSRNMVMDAFLLSLVTVALALDAVLQSRSVPSQARTDINKFIRRLRGKLADTLDTGRGVFSADVIRLRIDALGEAWPASRETHA